MNADLRVRHKRATRELLATPSEQSLNRLIKVHKEILGAADDLHRSANELIKKRNESHLPKAFREKMYTLEDISFYSDLGRLMDMAAVAFEQLAIKMSSDLAAKDISRVEVRPMPKEDEL